MATTFAAVLLKSDKQGCIVLFGSILLLRKNGSAGCGSYTFVVKRKKKKGAGRQLISKVSSWFQVDRWWINVVNIQIISRLAKLYSKQNPKISVEASLTIQF
jgi:hypothetical protein